MLKKIRETLMVVVIVTLGVININLVQDLKQMEVFVKDLEVTMDTMQDVSIDHEYVINELLEDGE